MTDQEIIILIKEDRQARAFAQLYRYFRPVQKLVRSTGGSKNDALDIYQDALVVLCRKVKDENFQLTSSLNSYLYGICRFLWRDEIRRRGRKPESDWDEDLEMEAEESDWKTTEQRLKQAETLLGKIGDRCRQLLHFFYTDNLDMKTIAKKMEFSSENVAKNQKYKCLEKLRDMVKTEDVKDLQY